MLRTSEQTSAEHELARMRRRGREAVLRYTQVAEKFHSMMMIYDFYDMAKEGDEWP